MKKIVAFLPFVPLFQESEISQISQLFKRITKKNFLSLLLFELFYRMTIVLVAIPLLSRLFRWSMNLMGYSYITPKNVVTYISNPFIILALVVFAAITLLLHLFEINALCSGFRYAYHGYSIKIAEMMLLAAHYTMALLKQYKGWIVIACISLFPFVNFHSIALLIYSVPAAKYLMNIIYSTVNSNCLIALLAVMLFFCGIAGAAIWSECMLTKRNPKKMKQEMLSIILKNNKKAGIYFFILHCLIWVLLVILYVVFMLVAILFFEFTVPQEAILSRILHISSQMLYFIGIFSSIIAPVAYVGVIFSTYGFHTFQAVQRDLLEETFVNRRASLRRNAKKITFHMVILITIVECGLCINLLKESSVFIVDATTEIAVTAHRGGAVYAPENTMAALEKSMEYGVEYIEVDVQMSSDGEVILFHDASTTRITGKTYKIGEMTYEQLQQLDVGSYFQHEFEGEKIPSLDEVLNYCEGKINVNIEIKEGSQLKDIASKVVEIIEANDFVGRCVVSSMDYHYLKQVKELNPDIPTGYILRVATGDLGKMEYADFYCMKHIYVTEAIVESIHKAGKELHVWTVNTENAAKRMKALGVDNIITDDPTLVRQVLTDDKSWTTLPELFYMLWGK